MSSDQQSTIEKFDGLEERDVYVTGAVSRGASVYHTDSDCQHITDSHKPILLNTAEERGFDECKYCSGEIEYKSPKPSNQCGAPTTKGHSCRMQPLAGFDRCSTHLDFDDVDGSDGSSSSDDRPVWERQKDDLLGESNE